tara:strand:- start:2322 stop:2969 length:648 start_codon:yes stop_codon:yes gene_type:complete
MGKMNIPPEAVNIFKELGINSAEATWDCHGTPVVLHRYIEIIAAKLNVSIELLDVVEANTKDGICSMKCIASINDRQVISYGECSPKNNKNAYPYAMAEKRAVDRCVLKLANLHGFVYSENEIDGANKPKKAETKIKGSVHTPLDGAMDDLTEEEHIEVQGISHDIINSFDNNQPFLAYEMFYDNELSNEVKEAVWFLLKPHSKIRTALTKMRKS